MNWLPFIAGFIAFPVVVLMVLLIVRRLSQAEPTFVNSVTGLQQQLRNLLVKGAHRDKLFVMSTDTNLLARIYKSKRKRKGDTLWLEVRKSETDPNHFDLVREALTECQLEFREELTPKLGRPSRLRLNFETGGPLVVSAVSHALEVIFSVARAGVESGLLVSRNEPSLWRKSSAGA